MFGLNTDYPRIPESIFKQYVGALVSPDGDILVRKRWLDVCVDPRLSVLVVDDNTGEVIHRVPPMIYTTANIVGNNIAGLCAEWRRNNEVSALHGNAFANRHIPDDIIMGESPPEDVELWQWIINQYGYGDGGNVESGGIPGLELRDNDDW